MATSSLYGIVISVPHPVGSPPWISYRIGLIFAGQSMNECIGLWCPEGRCVSWEATCDNITHCLNARDEHGCGEIELMKVIL